MMISVHHTCLLAFSPDSKTLVMGSGAYGGVEEPIHLWNWSDNKPGGSLKTDGVCVYLAFTADGKTLVTLNSHADLTLWDFAIFQERTTVKLNKPLPAAAAMSPDGKLLALTYRLPVNKGQFNEATGKVELLDTATGKLLETVPLEMAGQCVAFSPRGGLLAVGCRGKEQYPANRALIALGRDAEGDLSGVVRIWELRDLVTPSK